MNVQDLIEESAALFNNKKFDEAIEKLNQALGCRTPPTAI